MSAGFISQPATRQKGEIRLIKEPSSAVFIPPILAASRYVSPRSRPITPEESETRRIAYALKRGAESGVAAREMAGLLPPDLPTLTLVPVPASTGSIEANLILARAIAAEYGMQARVVPALSRRVPVESSCSRRRRGLPGLTAANHKFVRVGGWFALPVFLVDNVVTTGATLAAARHALGFGTGLVFADASPIYQPPVK
ncbi:MAG: hypothetical protein WCS65_15505 [Verrucomicrobiae bacterium]